MTAKELISRLAKAHDDAKVLIEHSAFCDEFEIGKVTITMEEDGTEYVCISTKKKTV